MFPLFFFGLHLSFGGVGGREQLIFLPSQIVSTDTPGQGWPMPRLLGPPCLPAEVTVCVVLLATPASFNLASKEKHSKETFICRIAPGTH